MLTFLPDMDYLMGARTPAFKQLAHEINNNLKRLCAKNYDAPQSDKTKLY